MIKSMYYPKRVLPWYKKIWKFRYRFYSVVFLLILSPVWYASSNGAQPTVDASGGRFQVLQQNVFASQIEIQEIQEEEEQVSVVEEFQFSNQGGIFSIGRRDSDGLNLGGSSGGSQIIEQAKALKDIVDSPINPSIVNFLQYPAYNISAPIVYSEISDLIKVDGNGNPITDAAGNLIPEDVSSKNSPILKKLENGIVHLALSPKPGDYWEGDYNPGCYITGHANAFAYSRDDYGSIFTPLAEKSKVGQEFIIYNSQGRKLTFRVFEGVKIHETETDIAYKSFPGRRVCTLQTCIFRWQNGKLVADQRWLTRGYLIDENGNEIPA